MSEVPDILWMTVADTKKTTSKENKKLMTNQNHSSEVFFSLTPTMKVSFLLLVTRFPGH